MDSLKCVVACCVQGVIAPGSDADIVIWNGNATQTFSAATHHAAVDFNVFEGMECHGVPEVVVCAGEVVMEHGEVCVRRGRGRYLKRPLFTPHVYSRVQQREKVGCNAWCGCDCVCEE